MLAAVGTSFTISLPGDGSPVQVGLQVVSLESGCLFSSGGTVSAVRGISEASVIRVLSVFRVVVAIGVKLMGGRRQVILVAH